jgi:hypothetical protein
MAKQATKKAAAKKVTAKKVNRKFTELKANSSWWNPKKKGEQIEGTLVDWQDVPKKGKFEAHQRPIIETEDGTHVTLPGHGILIKRLAGKEDSFFRLTYEGKSGKGKQQFHGYKIEIAE